jgi:hypothetical protein
MSATQQLIVFIEELFGDDESHKSALSALTAELTADEAEMNDLKSEVVALTTANTTLQATVASLGAPFDPTTLNGQVAALQAAVAALQARNAADDAAAGAAPNPDAPPVSVITLGPATLLDPTVGQPYSASVSATGSTAFPFAFSIASGALPDGLSLGAGGGISGTPGTAGSFDVSIQAHDANGDVGSISYTIEVDAGTPPVVSSSLSGVSSSLSSVSTSTSVSSSLSGVSSSLSQTSTTASV